MPTVSLPKRWLSMTDQLGGGISAFSDLPSCDPLADFC